MTGTKVTGTQQEGDPGQAERIAIGALHLHGEKGVLKLLEDYGYTLQRVAIKPAGQGAIPNRRAR